MVRVPPGVRMRQRRDAVEIADYFSRDENTYFFYSLDYHHKLRPLLAEKRANPDSTGAVRSTNGLPRSLGRAACPSEDVARLEPVIATQNGALWPLGPVICRQSIEMCGSQFDPVGLCANPGRSFHQAEAVEKHDPVSCEGT
ncbi:unnamed protein product [Protopolystoma xenopodis]|uniref:Uncharacterized protein n=1 Tax=Protopolystoma xenopodis TaxID=117903 RepID=A0A3S5FGE1_9PLAT|nr:unnamed protein product [Protopolystoma xenopodis]